MTDKLEPVSSAMKDFLNSCGINVEEYQRGIALQLLAKKNRKSPGTQSNKEYYERSSRTETIASVAQRIQAAPKVYIPLGYVLFKRFSLCACGASSYCMDCPSLYLLQTDKKGSTTRVYTPVPSVEFPLLPHYVKEISVTTLFCLECYSTEVLPEASAATDLAPSTQTANLEDPNCSSSSSGVSP